MERRRCVCVRACLFGSLLVPSELHFPSELKPHTWTGSRKLAVGTVNPETPPARALVAMRTVGRMQQRQRAPKTAALAMGRRQFCTGGQRGHAQPNRWIGQLVRR